MIPTQDRARIKQRHEPVRRNIIRKITIDRRDRRHQRIVRRRLRVNRRMQRRHQQRGRSSLARHVAERDHESTIFALDEVVVIAADLVTRKTDALKLVALYVRRSRLKTLLDLTGQREFTLKTLTFESCFNEPRILNTNRSD